MVWVMNQGYFASQYYLGKYGFRIENRKLKFALQAYRYCMISLFHDTIAAQSTPEGRSELADGLYLTRRFQ